MLDLRENYILESDALNRKVYGRRMLDFLVITIVILLFTTWLQMKPLIWKGAGIPYSIPVPIFGSMTEAFYVRLSDFFQNMYRKTGNNKMYGFHFFGKPGLLLRDPELIKKITVVHADHFMERGFHTNESYDPMSKGIFFAKGEQWKVVRSKMTPYFTPARIKSMLPLIQPISQQFTTFIIKEAKTGPVNIHEASMKLAVDVVTATAFGCQPDAFDNKDSFFFRLQKELLSFTFNLKTFFGAISPALYGFFKLSIFSFSLTDKIKGFVEDIIDQRLQGIGKRSDFVQGLVELYKKEDLNNTRITHNKDGTLVAKFDRFGVTGQCMMMYAAGTETTGNTLSFLLYELAKNPDVQQKARNEIDAMIQRTNNSYDIEDLNSLHYNSMVLKETLRKYPIVVIFTRLCTKRLKLEEIEIPEGTFITVSTTGLHHDPVYFPEPEKFIPERFADDNIITGTYAPFGLGPRICIGMKFAQSEIMLALCKLLPKVELSLSHKSQQQIRYTFNPTMSPADGIWLDVKEIK